MDNLNILAIEGVQGAGKTTLGVQLSDLGIVTYAPLISPIKRPKMFNQEDGGSGLSLLTDIMWFSSAVVEAMLYHNPTPIILDRFILSQWVYGTLRSSYMNSYPHILKDMLTLFTTKLTELLIDELLRRSVSEKVEIINQVNLVYLLLLPSEAEIRVRRETRPNVEFMYTAKSELKLYRKTLPILNKLGIHTIVLDGTEEIEAISERINATFLSLSS